MKMADKIQRQISKKQEEISALEGELAKLRSHITEAHGVITGLEAALQLIPKEPSESDFQQDVASIRSGSDVERAYEFLCARGESTRIEVIVEGIGKENTKKTRQALAGQLSYNYREGRIFTRPAPNTFGLLQWPDSEVSANDNTKSTNELELPNGFGE